MSELRVVGLDPSLTSSGLAFLTVGSDGAVQFRSKAIKSTPGAKTPTLVQRSNRLGKIVDQVFADILDFRPHVVLIERPAFDQKSGQHHDRSGLWWLIINILLNGGDFPLIEVGTSVLKKYATGRGNAKKLDVVIGATKRYSDLVEFGTDDEADAVIMAALGARLHGYPIEPSLPKPNLESLKSLTPLEAVHA